MAALRPAAEGHWTVAPAERHGMSGSPASERGEASGRQEPGRVVGQSLSVAVAGAVFAGAVFAGFDGPAAPWPGSG